MKIAVPLLLILFLPISARTQDLPENKENSRELADWIMQIVVEKSIENEKIKRERITYDKTVIKYDLEEKPPKQTESKIFSVYGLNGRSVEKLKEKDGKPVKNSPPEISKLNFNAILLERYDFNLEKEILWEGRGYYVISFKPKEPIDKLPFDTRIDEGINRAVGFLFIDMEKFYLRRMTGKLMQRFTKALAIFEMKEFTLEFQQEEFEGIIIPRSLSLTLKYRILLGETHEKIEYSYTNRALRP